MPYKTRQERLMYERSRDWLCESAIQQKRRINLRDGAISSHMRETTLFDIMGAGPNV